MRRGAIFGRHHLSLPDVGDVGARTADALARLAAHDRNVCARGGARRHPPPDSSKGVPAAHRHRCDPAPRASFVLSHLCAVGRRRRHQLGAGGVCQSRARRVGSPGSRRGSRAPRAAARPGASHLPIGCRTWWAPRPHGSVALPRAAGRAHCVAPDRRGVGGSAARHARCVCHRNSRAHHTDIPAITAALHATALASAADAIDAAALATAAASSATTSRPTAPLTTSLAASTRPTATRATTTRATAA